MTTSSTVHNKERELQTAVAQTVEDGVPEVEVLALELSGPDRFCVFIDHPEGVDHALCERVTQVLREYLLEYTVDVSSPGIERPVRTRSHFEAATGRAVSLRTAHALDGRKRFKGYVRDAHEQKLVLELYEGDEVEIPYDEIVRGNLIDEGR